MTDEQSKLVSVDFNVTRLGGQLDGWADLVEGMGDKTKEVREAILQELISKKIPNSQTMFKVGHQTVISDKNRLYITITKFPGITTTVYVGQHGTDLYISWRTYIKPVINWLLILLITGASIVIGLLLSENAGGYLFRPNQIFFAASIAAFFTLVAMFGKLGEILHHTPAHFFLVRVTVMTTDDITALSLAVHKAIFKAFDLVGIDTSKLRLKEKFSGGRKGEDI